MNPTMQPGYPALNINPVITAGKSVVLSVFSINFLQFIYVVMSLMVIGLITFILYILVRMYEIRQEDAKKKKPIVSPTAIPSAAAALATPTNTIWKHIREELLSDNSNDWKLAIIEADIYMDKILDDKGFHGDTTSDKLKQVTPDKLPSVQIAWEMHKVRNRIAHEGAAFALTLPEARRMLTFYEMIFTDLGVI